MKRLFICIFLLFSGSALFAQVASNKCLDEALDAFKQIDPDRLLHSDNVTRLAYTFTYMPRQGENKELVSYDEEMLFSRGVFHHKSMDFEEYSDSEEAFNFRKHQFVIYRTNSTLEKASMIPKLNSGFFRYCTVTNCEYEKVPGMDHAYKVATLKVNAEGIKKYGINKMIMHTDPVDSILMPVKIKVWYTKNQYYVHGTYAFTAINHDYKPSTPLAPVAKAVLNEEGEPRESFGGARLMDYRR